MSDLLAARSQMGLSLGFHIVFASIGMAMPMLMATSHALWLKTKNPTYREITKTWSKGVAIFFAVGAVSGTLLSVELGLLWPTFMKHAGPIIGMPFSWEGAAFFLEAIALGIFLYGWNRIPDWIHWLSGLVVGISGIASAFFVVCANAWMNSPTGFVGPLEQATHIDPLAAMFNPGAFQQAIHMILAAFVATSFAVAGLHALALRKRRSRSFHLPALKISLVFAISMAILQPLSGDLLARQTAKLQPTKLAAMEALFHTKPHAPLLIGGIPLEKEQMVKYGIHIPSGLSLLLHHDPQAVVKGLDVVPFEERPPILVVHAAFQIMVACGVGLVLAAFFSVVQWKRKKLEKKWFLSLLVICLPLGFFAIEAGWVVTEVGRQPWIIQGILKTKDAVTPMPGISYTFLLFTVIYVFLSFVVAWLLKRQVIRAH